MPPEKVWITAESLSDRDPACAAHPELPVIFVFDEPLLRRLQALRAPIGVPRFEPCRSVDPDREVQVFRGDPVDVLAGQRLAATFAPVPGWRTRAGRPRYRRSISMALAAAAAVRLGRVVFGVGQESPVGHGDSAAVVDTATHAPTLSGCGVTNVVGGREQVWRSRAWRP